MRLIIKSKTFTFIGRFDKTELADFGPNLYKYFITIR